MSPALAGRFSTTVPPGKPHLFLYSSDVVFLSLCVCVYVERKREGEGEGERERQIHCSMIIPDKPFQCLVGDNVYCATDPGIKSVPCVII